MNKILLVVVVVVLICTTGFLLSYQKEKKSPSPSSVSPTNTTEIDLGFGGSSYLDEKGVYSVLYPNDYVLDTQDPQHIRVYKRGDTQRPQSEMSDGVLLVFESVDLRGMSLETLVNTRIEESTADGTSEVIEPKKAVSQNTYQGFEFVLRGLGTSQNLVLQKEKNSKNAVIITYSVSDPQRKGYQKEVDAVISSIKLLK